jgi:hypothetical protein
MEGRSSKESTGIQDNSMSFDKGDCRCMKITWLHGGGEKRAHLEQHLRRWTEAIGRTGGQRQDQHLGEVVAGSSTLGRRPPAAIPAPRQPPSARAPPVGRPRALPSSRRALGVPLGNKRHARIASPWLVRPRPSLNDVADAYTPSDPSSIGCSAIQVEGRRKRGTRGVWQRRRRRRDWIEIWMDWRGSRWTHGAVCLSGFFFLRVFWEVKCFNQKVAWNPIVKKKNM